MRKSKSLRNWPKRIIYNNNRRTRYLISNSKILHTNIIFHSKLEGINSFLFAPTKYFSQRIQPDPISYINFEISSGKKIQNLSLEKNQPNHQIHFQTINSEKKEQNEEFSICIENYSFMKKNFEEFSKQFSYIKLNKFDMKGIESSDFVVARKMYRLTEAYALVLGRPLLNYKFIQDSVCQNHIVNYHEKKYLLHPEYTPKEKLPYLNQPFSTASLKQYNYPIAKKIMEFLGGIYVETNDCEIFVGNKKPPHVLYQNFLGIKDLCKIFFGRPLYSDYSNLIPKYEARKKAKNILKIMKQNDQISQSTDKLFLSPETKIKYYQKRVNTIQLDLSSKFNFLERVDKNELPSCNFIISASYVFSITSAYCLVNDLDIPILTHKYIRKCLNDNILYNYSNNPERIMTDFVYDSTILNGKICDIQKSGFNKAESEIMIPSIIEALGGIMWNPEISKKKRDFIFGYHKYPAVTHIKKLREMFFKDYLCKIKEKDQIPKNKKKVVQIKNSQSNKVIAFQGKEYLEVIL